MSKSQIMSQIKANKLVLVVRGDSLEEAIKSSNAAIKGGIKTIEVTYTNRFASDAISELVTQYDKSEDVVIGAGTVLDPETARIAILAGAQFIVSPNFNPETSLLCNRYGVPYIPGCMTISEVVSAMETGVEMVKLFPGSTVGMSFIKAIKSPLPQVEVMVTGGVNLNNVTEWFEAGAEILGIGGDFSEAIKNNRFDLVTEKSRNYIQISISR